MAHTAGRSARRAAAVAFGLLALCAAPAARGQTGRGHVIGIWPLVSLTQSEIGVGISSSALQRPCP